MKVLMPAVHAELLNSAVVITGPPRSGTTLLGKLVGSLQGLDYRFEPPSLRMLTATHAAGELSLELGAKLLSAYLCEDIFVESLLGRGLNFRPDDDSLIFSQLSWSQVVSRWTKFANRRQAINHGLAEARRLCIKMPFMLDSLALLRAAMPACRLIVCVRNGIDVVTSMLRKQWLSDDVLELELWPYAGRRDGVNIPSWVPVEFHDRWPGMSPATRACLVWSIHADHGLRQRHSADLIELRYEELVSQPRQLVQQLADRLGHGLTPLTEHWIASVRRPPASPQPASAPFAAEVDDDVYAQFTRLNACWGYPEPQVG